MARMARMITNPGCDLKDIIIRMNSTEFYEVDLEACRQNFRARQQQKVVDAETRRRQARAAILHALRFVLPSHPELRRIFLFGSVTREGAFHAASDIDVAVEGTNAEQYFALWHELGNVAQEWTIDLREINQPSYFTSAVQQRGELIYERQDHGSAG
jgi:predicted nucleotidyltransferase